MAEVDKVLRRLRRHVSQAMLEHTMLSDGDHVLVGLSGGKDSWALLALLVDLQKRAPISYQLSAVTIDGGLVGLDPGALEKTCHAWNVPFHLSRQSIFATVAEKKDAESTFCSMCARLRRGALYTFARKIGATKIALGHHLDDAVETLLLNLFYNGRTAALPPVLLSHSGHVPILRPLIYCDEPTLAAYAQQEKFPMIGCACPVCPTHPDHEFSDLKRTRIKKLISALALEVPGLRNNVRSALGKLEPTRFADPRYSEKADMVELTHRNLPFLSKIR